MKIEEFLLERWMTRHETHVRFDIAESGILPLSTQDLLNLLPPDQRASALDALLTLPLGYSEARGTEALRALLAATYQRADADSILVTTGAIEANFLLFNCLLDPGDHMIAPFPAYQQLYSVPKAIGCDVSLWHVGPETGYQYDARARETGHAENESHRRQHAAQSDGRDVVARRCRACVRAGRKCRRDGDRRRSVSLARGAERRAVRAAVFRSRPARHQRRHVEQAVRAARSPNRLDRGSAGSDSPVLELSRLRDAQPRQAE